MGPKKGEKIFFEDPVTMQVRRGQVIRNVVRETTVLVEDLDGIVHSVPLTNVLKEN
jgi:hypothetical protein